MDKKFVILPSNRVVDLMDVSHIDRTTYETDQPWVAFFTSGAQHMLLDNRDHNAILEVLNLFGF